MFNPYVALGGLLAFVAAVSGAFFEGKTVEAGAQAQTKLTALTDAIADGKAKSAKIDQLEAERQQLENFRQSAVREIYHETAKIIERPVYKTVCIDQDGVNLLDRAADVASGHPTAQGEPPPQRLPQPQGASGSSPLATQTGQPVPASGASHR
jgi:hypothetical protein